MEYWEQFIAGIVVGYSIALLVHLQKRRNQRAEERRVRRVISGYFKTHDLQANVSCVHSPRGFFTLIECDGSRKARFSAIRELAITEHVKKVLGKDLNGVHWRFRQNRDAATEEPIADEIPNYPDHVVSAGQKNENYDVNEISWDNYESVLRTGADAQMDACIEPRSLAFKFSA